MVGYVMVCYGASTAVLSYVFGRVAKYTGRYPLFAASYLLELGAVLCMLLWKPSPDTLYANFIFVLVCATSDGMWLTQSAGKCCWFIFVCLAFVLIFQSHADGVG